MQPSLRTAMRKKEADHRPHSCMQKDTPMQSTKVKNLGSSGILGLFNQHIAYSFQV
eukprot:c1895_g1_i1 orf=103-270(-)